MTTTAIDRVGDILKVSTEYLEARNVYQARQACELLMACLLKCGRLELFVKYETRLVEKQLDAMRRGVKRLAAGEPVQYILGRVEFMGNVFKVDKRALIPRPETELLVEAMLSAGSVWQPQQPTICDVGAGSGCIMISLALAKPGGKYFAVDTSAEALELAAENAKALGVRAALGFYCGGISDAVEPDSLDAVAANLPYVSTADWQSLPKHIRDFEPRAALDGGPDGLSVIGDVVPDVWFALRPGGTIFLEIGAGQAGKVRAMLRDAEFADIEVRRDLAGLDRIVTARKAE